MPDHSVMNGDLLIGVLRSIIINSRLDKNVEVAEFILEDCDSSQHSRLDAMLNICGLMFVANPNLLVEMISLVEAQLAKMYTKFES